MNAAPSVPSLVRPPWQKGAAARVPIVVRGLEVLAQPDRIKRGGRLVYAEQYQKLKPHGGARLEAHRAQLATLVATNVPLSVTDLLWLPRDEGLALWNRPEVRFRQSDFDVRNAIGVWGRAALPGAVARMSEGPKDATDGLGRVASTAIAPFMAKVAHAEQDGSDDAKSWLLLFPITASLGLMPNAVGEVGAARDAAESALRFLDARGFGGVVRAVAVRYGASLAVAEILAFVPPKKPKALPKGFVIPPLAPLGESEVRVLLSWLASWAPGPAEELARIDDGEGDEDASEDDEEGDLAVVPVGEDFDEGGFDYDGLCQSVVVHRAPSLQAVDEVKQTCSAEALDRFSLALLAAWTDGGALPKDKWLLFAASALGGERTVSALRTRLDAWFDDKKKKKETRLCLDALLHLKTDTSVSHLAELGARERPVDLALEARHRAATVGLSLRAAALAACETTV